jgi:hypothetical protein
METHGMSHLLCNFAARITEQDKADHGYTYANAKSTLNDPVLCPEAVMVYDIQRSLIRSKLASSESNELYLH